VGQTGVKLQDKKNIKFKNLIIYIARDQFLKEIMTTLMLVSVGVPDGSFVGLKNIF
jgi:hypothetical protein